MATEITYENQPEDVVAIFKAQPWGVWLRSLVPLLQFLHLFWPVALLALALQEAFLLRVLGYAALAIGVLQAAMYLRARLRLPLSGKVFPGPQTVRLYEDYLEMQMEDAAVRRPWKYVRQVAELGEHLVLYVQKDRAYVIPKRFFPSPDDAGRFLAEARRLHAQAEHRPGPHFSWEEFCRDIGLPAQKLVRHLRWQHDPQLNARLMTTGVDVNNQPAKKVPTAWGLATQLLLPLALCGVLLVLRYGGPGLDEGVAAMYYLLLVLTSLFLFVFGVTLSSRRQYLRELRHQRSLTVADEAWFYENGIGSCSPEAVGFNPWRMIEKIDEDREAIVLYDLPPFLHTVIPKTAFTTPEEATSFLEQIQTHHDIAHDKHNEIILAEITDNPFQSPSSM